MTLWDDSTAPDVVLAGIDETLLVGGGGNDKLGAAGPRSPARRLLLQGDVGNDLLVGGRGQDSLFGGAGTDRIEGGFGPDVGDGGPGNDFLIGSNGRDRLRGLGGSDSLSGGPDSDRIAAGDGDDAAVGGPGGDALLGGRGGDELEGKEDGDRVVGGPGADVAAGQTGRDTVFGKAEPDRLTGGPGEDRVLGGERGDLLFGGDGGDGLLGGDGRDTCYQGGGGGFRSSCERPGSKRPFPVTRAKRILVVNQNLKEVHTHVPDDIYPASGDQQRSQELWNFARRLSNILTQAPDVLLLQEVSGPAALKTARYLTARFRMRYRAVVRPEKSLWVRVVIRNGNYHGVDVYKRNTAIVINARTIDFRRGGYRSTPQLERDRTDGIRTIQHHAHALLREERTEIKMSAMSIHFNGNPFFPSPEQGKVRRTHWSKVVAAFARRRYPGVTSRMIAGEFCQRRCQRGGLETIRCEVNRFWRILTGDFGYRDAVFVANRTSNEDLAEQATSRAGKPMRIDYIFARPKVVRASRDIGYTADKGERNFISDHRGNWVLMEIRR